MCREYTNKLLEMIEDGLSADTVVMAFCKYCSEDEVKDLMECNELIDEKEVVEDEH